MMDAVQYLKVRKRMCEEMEHCYQCPKNKLSGDMNCLTWELNDPEKAVEIVEAWMKEHPAKTRAEDFFEKFPNASKDLDGTPTMCVVELGYTDGCHRLPGKGDCVRCWSEPVK